MKLVLLSGGSGKRLWPLSNDARSKQFLKVLQAPNGEAESMVQRVWRQLKQSGLHHDVYVSTSKSQVETLQSQLGNDAPIIVEPDRRDTFPAIALAATYLYSIVGIGLNEIVAVLPVDPYVEDEFFTKVRSLEALLYRTGSNIGLIGVKPTYSSTKYGYIVPRSKEIRVSEEESYMNVSHFIEKPRKEKAKELVEQQSLWNCGVFAFKLDYLIQLLIQKGLPIQYDEMLKNYHRLPSISFDYEVLEKTSDVIAIPYDGFWKDLGTWNTLTEEMAQHLSGKGVISESCTNTHLINELDIPIAVIGMHDTIVTASPDGILVSSKEESPRLKDVIKQFDQRPMYEERRWGWYKVLDYGITSEGEQVLTKRICIYAGKNISYQKHLKRSEIWTIISGEGEFILNDQLMRVRAGDVLRIPVEAKHSLRAEQNLEFIEVQTGSELIEEDIVRYSTSWDEMILLCS